MPLLGLTNLELLLHIGPYVHRTGIHMSIGPRSVHLVSHVVCPHLVMQRHFESFLLCLV